MPMLILSFAPQTREAAAAVAAPMKNLLVVDDIFVGVVCSWVIISTIGEAGGRFSRRFVS